MFFTGLLVVALVITLQSLYTGAEHWNGVYDAPRCPIRMCLTGPPPVCEKLKMKPCYADREVMTMFGKNFLCDTKTDGGGWILMQRRIRPGVNFKENWQTYKEGFGTLSGDFWIGLDFIYLLMTQHNYELRIDMMYQNRSYYAKYGTFRIANEADRFRLTISDYSGTAGNSLNAHNNSQFYTIDRSDGYNCAAHYEAGWWFNRCYSAYLNGVWVETSRYEGIHWDALGFKIRT
ncbi:angiopoietin-related protein 1-like isoform X2 [Physella acuta]|uniref:angiopoietin-related protein 1-like isoform X2 n=1 Tax=Physella acuta TaxID=109671 RepID=UPI0027DDF7A1|nr:angiopoietin-related protein 1-like isoform X2 [Physella acuta]XP_059178646.1 angiopoietin-related protein 1-like isoform X2 [Physella acuta]